MKLLLGSLLLAGVCGMAAAVNVPVMRNFNNRRIAKAWYPLLTIPIGATRSVRFHPFTLLAQPMGNLKYSFKVPENGRCLTKELVLQKQGQPGDYTTTAPSTVRFVQTDYRNYFIAYVTQGTDNADSFLALAGCQPTVTPALEAKLRATATCLGITGEILHSVLLVTC